MSESNQHKLDRVRPPRVQITYDVEVGDAIVKKELPFVVGVMADLSGNPEEPLPNMKARKFVEIDRDNFNGVLESYGPRTTFQAENLLAKDGSKLNVELKFNDIDDFEPVNVVNQVEPMRELLAARNRLRDLLAKLDGNDTLDTLLRNVIANSGDQDALRKQLDAAAKAAAAEEKPAE